MKIEALEPIKSDGFVLDSGDIKQQVPDDIGARWCRAGWAKDLDGAIPTGERKVLKVDLDVQPSVLTTLAQVAGE